MHTQTRIWFGWKLGSCNGNAAVSTEAYITAILREEKLERVLRRVRAEMRERPLGRSSKEWGRAMRLELGEFECRAVMEEKILHVARLAALCVEALEQYVG